MQAEQGSRLSERIGAVSRLKYLERAKENEGTLTDDTSSPLIRLVAMTGMPGYARGHLQVL